MSNTPSREIQRLEDLFTQYANKTNVDVTKKHLSESEGKNLFSLIVSDYQKGKVAFDDLSSLCEQAYNKFKYDEELCILLLEGADLEWDIRNNLVSATETIKSLYKYFNIKV